MKVASTIELPVQIKNGKLASNLNTIGQILQHYEGHTIDIRFKKRTNKRSNQQNSYYFAVVVPIFQNCIREQCGEIWALQRVHEFLLNRFNLEEIINTETGQILTRTRRTTENTTLQQEDYHTKCREFCLEFFNTEIPLPDKDLKLDFNG